MSSTLVLGLATATAVAGLAGIPAAAAPAATTLTAAQATAAINQAITQAQNKAVRTGVRIDEQYRSTGARPTTLGTTSVVVDTARHRVREDDYLKNYAYATASEPTDWCRRTPSDDLYGRRVVSITRAGVGRWESLDKRARSSDRDQLALLKRPKVRWVAVKASKSTTAGALRDSWTMGSLRQTFSDKQVTGATSTTDASGTRYVVTYRSYYSDATATLTATVGVDGALVSSVEIEPFGTPGETLVMSYALKYGPQWVTLPKKALTVTRAKLIPACHAVLIRDEVDSIARVTADDLNNVVHSPRSKVKVSEIRQAVKDWRTGRTGYLKTSIKVTKIPGGVKIVGKHRLLPHREAYTLVVKKGRAVAHKVR